MLPYVPHYAWILPGKIWMAVPWLFVVLVVTISWSIIAGARRWPPLARRSKPAAWLIVIVAIIIHALWGGAILLQPSS